MLQNSGRGANVFRILVIDDDQAGAVMLREVMKHVRRRHELHFVWDGLEALDFLHRRGAHASAPRPNLILLDINMPRLRGLETLSYIKCHPELYTIPVIMLSGSSSPDDVRDSYQARANCYVQKPYTLEQSVKLVLAVETFWMDFALVLASDSWEDYGRPIAPKVAEASSPAMSTNDSPEKKIAIRSRRSGCEVHNRLLDEFGVAVQELLALHEQQFQAIVEGDTECSRFDLLIHMANEKKQLAKYAYLRHLEAHGCSNWNDVKQTRT